MAGINGLSLGFRADASLRVHKFTVMVKGTALTSSQKVWPAAIPGAQNAAGLLGVLTEHFVEPNYFVPQGTNPTTVTGSAPTLYNLQSRGMTLQVNGVARCIAAGAINQGDTVIIADSSGRVQSLATSGIAAGTTVYLVGIAQHSVSSANDIVQVLLNFVQSKM